MLSLDSSQFMAVFGKTLAKMRTRFTWSGVLQPLVEFCAAPRRAPDLLDAEMARALKAGNIRTRPAWRRLRRDLELALLHLRSRNFGLLAATARSRLSGLTRRS